MTAKQLDFERRCAGNRVNRDPVQDDELYRLIQSRLAARGVLHWTLHWPEIDLAIRDAVAEYRLTTKGTKEEKA
ncbi:hypothetical protein [Zavarzinia sp.]|uniref:hypothetical protein n=1 Tax=Zavarzinia sp. TaxID=2027920 RepID=UPI00356523B8